MTNAFRMSGLVPATFTPMHADGSLNLGVVPAMVERLIDFRSNALFVCGTVAAPFWRIPVRIVCLDLEGVLVPEIWIEFSERTKIPELRRTTRDEPDYDKLMNYRLNILREHKLGLPDIQKVIGEMGPMEIVRRTAADSQGFTLPGWEPERLALLETTLRQYEKLTPDDLRANYKYFLDAVIPVCEEVGIRMACHPDDPAWPIFGLPRIAHSQEDFDKIIKLHDSPANTVCLCTGSLGCSPDNDIPSIIRHFGEMNRIGAMHVRNIKFLGYHHFREAAHLSEAGDLNMFDIMEAIYDTCPDTYIRPDHGRMIWDEKGRPGYGLYDRALGATYLNGLWEAICRMKGEKK